MRTDNKGFTLIELMIAIAIIGILSVTTAPHISKAMQNSGTDRASVMVRSILSDVELYLTERGTIQQEESGTMQAAVIAFINEFNTNYTATSFDISTLEVGANSFTVKTGVSADPWGNKFVLYYSWTNNVFVVASAGPNSQYDFLPRGGSGNGWGDDICGAAIIKQI